ncbi:MAG: hypothetical protein ACUVWB_14440 [Anaerolineae bacterium]
MFPRDTPKAFAGLYTVFIVAGGCPKINTTIGLFWGSWGVNMPRVLG